MGVMVFDMLAWMGRLMSRTLPHTPPDQNHFGTCNFSNGAMSRRPIVPLESKETQKPELRGDAFAYLCNAKILFST
jgi:hypothetical protein